MDFILFLVVVAVLFYFNKLTPAIQQASQTHTEHLSTAEQPSVQPTSAFQTPRATIPPLLGIEISAAQQRRLGANDPSVLAANRAKSLHAKHHRINVFDQLTQYLEKTIKPIDMTTVQQKQSHQSFKQDDLKQLFQDLFNPKK